MESGPQVGDHTEVTGAEQKPTIVEQIKVKVSAVKDKLTGHGHDHPADGGHDQGAHGHGNEHSNELISPRGHKHERVREGIVLTERVEKPVPEGGLILTAAPEDAVDPHHGLVEKIKNVFKFPVPDPTLTPTEDFEETVPPNLKI